MPLAEDVLARLLQRGERAAQKQSARAINESFRDPDSLYWAQSLDDRDRAHERFRDAERAGAVALTWARQGGDDRPLEQVRLLDLQRLAVFLDVDTVAGAVEQAHAVLRQWNEGVPRVQELLAAWASMRNPRGLDASTARDFATALVVLDALKERAREDQIVRVLSVELFGSSKRIEQLERHLDVLTADSLSAPARHRDEVFGSIGMVKEPQPFLVAGTGSLRLAAGPDCPVAVPFVGVSNRAIVGYAGTPRWVLTIENLTTFHLASQRLDGGDGLIVYTCGMPSPSWCAAYARVLASLPTSIPAFHWGDIDQGGFRIAAHIRNRCVQERQFLPWQMDAGSVQCVASSEATESARAAMARCAANAGWKALSEAMLPVCIEQEGVEVVLPDLD